MELESVVSFNKQIGLALSKIRSEKGFSQECVVRKLQVMGVDMDRGSYSQIENGNRKLNAFEIPFLANVFEMDLHKFVDKILNF